ncbi:hypothetical protein A6F68_01341 [Tsuneonella dongtanensis]|uniref:Phosphotransferase enzyme family protein n=1 Tax=Tsuneonella dongtanensis TaxID=692370 RepID=A0A1B2ACN0_9SPHN|nr:oxidoreductase family protein [Tsuneonella dongtanensis]ANY19858.1 hypothetical protein A6F68_01341 [Tsuneonella dongtanensis]
MPSFAQTIELPKSLEDIDAAFMTQVLRRNEAIAATNEVVRMDEEGVGMTAGYFSAIKRVHCTYKEPTEAPRSFVVKAWPELEIAPKENIRAMFIKDIKGYQMPADRFYPRPITHLAAFDAERDRWALVMEDACAYADQKLHESELTFDETMRMIPGLVDVAVAWEGADSDERAQELEALDVGLWASRDNLDNLKALTPGSAKLMDHLLTMDSVLVGSPTWDKCLGPRFAETLARKTDAFFAGAHPANGATCTLAHGDLRGDNLFFCDGRSEYPHGWLCIDFQLLFRGPIPSDLAYLMTSGSVLPEVYAQENLHRILRAFYDTFMARTRRYPDYTYDAFVDEFAMMSTVCFLYYLAFGGVYAQGGAYRNELGMRVEMGGKGATEADLAPEELRQRMWWGKTYRNAREVFRTLKLRERLDALPENTSGMGEWAELPPHLL